MIWPRSGVWRGSARWSRVGGEGPARDRGDGEPWHREHERDPCGPWGDWAWGHRCATRASVWRTERCSATTRRQAISRASGSSRPSSARACPWLIWLERTASRISSGSSSRRIRLETVERSRPSRPASSSCVPPYRDEVIAEGAGLVDRVEVLALEVLDHRQLEDALIVEVEDARGDLVEVGLDAGAEPTLAGDELVAQPDGPDQDRLEHAVLPERVGQRGDLRRVELAARLERVGIDLIDGDLELLGPLERSRFESAFLTPQQGFQAASETTLIHGR